MPRSHSSVRIVGSVFEHPLLLAREVSSEPPDGPSEKIFQLMVEGTYLPGQRLIEQRSAEELKVSRTPVRETFRRLETAGLIVAPA